MYLQRIELNNFRAFGKNCNFALQAGPGMTLLVGPNGLGKSSFFEGVEWCLTNTVGRLLSLADSVSENDLPNVLWNMNSGNDKCVSVGLEFASSDNSIAFRRSIVKNGHHWSEPEILTAAAVINLLKKPESHVKPSELAGCLRVTHFLSQAVGQRLTGTEPRACWGWLQGPLGVERLNRLRQRVDKMGLSKALVASRDDLYKELQFDEGNLSKLEESERNIHELEVSAGLDGLLLEAELVELWSRIESLFEEDQLTLAHSSDGLLDALRLVDERRATGTKRASEIGRATELVSEFCGVQELLLQTADEIVRLDKCMVDQEASLDNARQVESQAEKNRLDAEKLYTDVNNRYELVSQIQLKESTLRQLQEDMGRALERKSELLCKAAGLEREIQRHRIDINEVRQLEASLLANNDSMQSLNHILERIDALTFEEEVYEKLSLESVTMEVAVKSFPSSDAIQQEVLTMKEDVARLSESANAEQERFSDLQDAIVLIAESLTDDSKKCPICGDLHEPVGELKRLAYETVGQMKSSLSDILFEKEAKSRKVAELELLATEQKNAIGLLTKIQKELQVSAKRKDDIFSELNVHPALRDKPRREYSQAATKSIEILVNERQDILNNLATRESMTTVSLLKAKELEFGENNANITTQQQQIAMCEMEVTKTQAEIVEINKQLQMSSLSNEEIDANYCLLSGRVQTLIQELNQRVKEVAKLAEAKRNAEDNLQQTQNARNTAVAQLKARKECLRLLSERWTNLGLNNDPSFETLNMIIAANETELKEVEDVCTCIGRLRRHYDVAGSRQKLVQIKNELAALTKQLGAESLPAAKEIVSVRIEELKRRQVALDRVEVKRAGLLNVLQQESDAYVAKVLVPLAARNKSFMNALGCRQGFEFDLQAAASYGKRGFKTTYQNRTRKNVTHTASHIMSEGQMAALSVSLLMSMSTHYQWSRWKALLLDDPVQHNDIIHAAAFVDVARNLILDQNYQIIMSTHDSDLADFIRRKMEAKNVPLKIINFRGIGRGTVIYD